MPKDSYIHIRCTEQEKEYLKVRADALHMNMSEFIVHAGICYKPTPEIMESINRYNAVMKQPMDMSALNAVSYRDSKEQEGTSK